MTRMNACLNKSVIDCFTLESEDFFILKLHVVTEKSRAWVNMASLATT